MHCTNQSIQFSFRESSRWSAAETDKVNKARNRGGGPEASIAAQPAQADSVESMHRGVISNTANAPAAPRPERPSTRRVFAYALGVYVAIFGAQITLAGTVAPGASVIGGIGRVSGAHRGASAPPAHRPEDEGAELSEAPIDPVHHDLVADTLGGARGHRALEVTLSRQPGDVIFPP